jgi:hypothetical protein
VTISPRLARVSYWVCVGCVISLLASELLSTKPPSRLYAIVWACLVGGWMYAAHTWEKACEIYAGVLAERKEATEGSARLEGEGSTTP